ncbi:uncharacterized protein LOC144166528 [Haemaphysalis longicornis]
MDRAATTSATAIGTTRGLLVWQWNCNGFARRKAVLQQHLEQTIVRPDVIVLQETFTEEVKLPGYKASVSTPSLRDTTGSTGRGACTLVRKDITFLEHEVLGVNSLIEPTFIEVVTGKKSRKDNTFILNVYSSPAHRKQKFKALLHKANRITGPSNRLVLCGKFKAPNQAWGYSSTLVKGRELLQDATDLGLTLITNPADPTRMGNSVARNTTPDLAFVRSGGSDNADTGDLGWWNTGHELGSEHYIVEIAVPLSSGDTGTNSSNCVRTHKITDWDAFQWSLPGETVVIEDIEGMTEGLMERAAAATREIETDASVERVGNRLAHLTKTKKALPARWKAQRTNRKLRQEITELNRGIEAHCRTLSAQRWHEICSAADRQMHCGRTWTLLRHLLDETKTKSHQRDRLTRSMHAAITECREDEVRRRLDAKYLPATPAVHHPDYQGAANSRLDRDIEVWEVRAAQHDINTSSAAGPDRVTNKVLKNLGESAIASLTDYYNRCWRAGTLPWQWKAAKTILIPKLRKP